MTDHTRTHDDSPVSRLDLELLALKRLPPERVADIEQRAQEDPELAERVARVRQEIDDAAFDLPALRLPMEEEEAPRGLAAWLRWTPLALAGALAAAMGLLAINTGPVPTEPQEAGQRFRGAFELEVWHVRGGEAVEEELYIEAAAGDRVQYAITPGQDSWVAVYNVQDNGEVSTYMAPTQLEAKVTEESAVLLDDYAGAERIFVLVTEAPVPQLEVESAVQRAWNTPLTELDHLPGVPRTDQKSILVVKK